MLFGHLTVHRFESNGVLPHPNALQIYPIT